ncbi:MAG TPA: DUF1697 domain-containing protein [Longimicrobium sp.]|jgi:uncharacterized protein (DUF1697 family)|nr:DUF1697 domain-containing protein [Longimicrobium sp.]
MQRYVAFMRALNVGGHTVKMDHLRSLFEALGFTGVESFIASGNIVFDSPSTDAAELEERIERHLQQSLGYEVATFLRTPAEVAAAAAHRPFAAADPVPDGHTLSVVFLKTAPGAEVGEKVSALATEYDDLHIHGRELYWWCHGRSSDTLIRPGKMDKALGMPGTSRNVTTVRKLAAKYPA